MWQAHLAVAAATGRRTWRWKVEWQLPLPRKDFTLTGLTFTGVSKTRPDVCTDGISYIAYNNGRYYRGLFSARFH